jgi:hypothetical protein
MKRKTKNNNTIGNTAHLLQGAVIGLAVKGAAVFIIRRIRTNK